MHMMTWPILVTITPEVLHGQVPRVLEVNNGTRQSGAPKFCAVKAQRLVWPRVL
jgi:hypothetical protein